MTKVHRNAQRTNRVRRGGMPFHQLLNSRRVLPVPEAVDGKERCPVCRNVASLTTRGYLRRHRDLFGHDCHNVARDTSTT